MGARQHGKLWFGDQSNKTTYLGGDGAGGLSLVVGGVEVMSTTALGVIDVLNVGGATIAEINAAADVSSRRVAITDADTPILAANSGKTHIIANVSADRTFTLPTPADGLEFLFIPGLNAADGHDWIFTTGSDTNYFMGGVVHLDSDAQDSADELVLVVPDGNSNSKFQINLPQPGTMLRFISDGVLWYVAGQVMSTTAPAFADQ